ncbi:MAG: glycosyl hydrolase, partial [Bacteroidota bacterium]
GFESQIDPVNPNIVYAQSQHGGLIRFDKASGEQLSIQPLPAPGEEAYRWNWDSPLLISPHKNTRLYFAANKLFRSEDRGESWTVISPDLTRQIDRNTLPVMGKIWDAEAVAKNASTSLYGNIVSFDESPVKEGLLYVGTDDGLIQVSEDAGATWRKIERVAGVPENTYVSCLRASAHDANTVYACFDNHKMADFKPYVMKSINRGQSWTALSANLPVGAPVYTLAEDHKKAALLFVGTEYGVHTSVDGGNKWVQLKTGLPTIAVKDIAIQQRENDLVLATFGRGFYVLDDYSPLRDIDGTVIEKDAVLFPVRDALMYNESNHRAIGNQGETFFATPNPDFGAVFTYYIKDDFKSLKQQRQEEEKKLRKDKKTPPYPGWDALRAEADQTTPYLLFTIRDSEGNVIRRLREEIKSGLQRTNWDLRSTSTAPVSKDSKTNDHQAMLAMPGQYTVELTKVDNGQEVAFAGPVTFTARVLENTTLPTQDRASLAAFHKRLMEVQRVGLSAQRYTAELQERLLVLEKTMLVTPKLETALRLQWTALRDRVRDINRVLNGDRVISERNGAQQPSVMDRLGEVAWGQWNSTSGPTAQHSKEIELVAAQLRPLLDALRGIGERDIPAMAKALEQLGAPYIPGHLPELR